MSCEGNACQEGADRAFNRGSALIGGACPATLHPGSVPRYRPVRAAGVPAEIRSAANSRRPRYTRGWRTCSALPCGRAAWSHGTQGTQARNPVGNATASGGCSPRARAPVPRTADAAPFRQHLVPMVHETQVAAIIARQIIEVVAEGLAFREVLLVGAETSVHRVAAHVDDGGVRQHGVNQPT